MELCIDFVILTEIIIQTLLILNLFSQSGRFQNHLICQKDIFFR